DALNRRPLPHTGRPGPARPATHASGMTRLMPRWGARSSGRGRWSAAIAPAACAYLLLAGASSASATPSCTHGASSVGPVALVNGHLTGDTTPDTQVCLP